MGAGFLVDRHGVGALLEGRGGVYGLVVVVTGLAVRWSMLSLARSEIIDRNGQ